MLIEYSSGAQLGLRQRSEVRQMARPRGHGRTDRSVCLDPRSSEWRSKVIRFEYGKQARVTQDAPDSTTADLDARLTTVFDLAI